MRILILSFYYEPDLSAGSFRATCLVNALRKNIGPDALVDVLTTHPNRYATYSKAAPSEEVNDAVTIKRFRLPAHKNGFIDQSVAFLSYAYQVINEVRHKEYDLVFATSSRLFTATLGGFISAWKRAPLFLDIRDIFVDTLKDVLPKLGVLILPLAQILEKLTIKKAAHINVVSPGFIEYFMQRYKNLSMSIISNGIDDIFFGINYKKLKPNSSQVVLYAGNIGGGQGLDRIIPGLAMGLSETHEFWIVGDGSERTMLESAVNNLCNVKILPPMSRLELIELYRRSDILLLHLNDYPAFQKVLPSKLFEYAATGKPIVAGVAGCAAEFLQAVPGVQIFKPCDVNGGLHALRSIDCGNVDRANFIEKYTRSKLMQELAGLIIVVAKKHRV